MTAMTTFHETDHPRAGGGRFTEKCETPDIIHLTPASDDVVHAALTVTAAIEYIGERATRLTPAEDQDLADQVDCRDQAAVERARHAIHVMGQRETASAALDGRAGDYDSVNPNRGLTEQQFDDEFFRHGSDLTDAHATALTASYEASLALTYRWKLGRDDCPAWDQNAYDTLTRPWAKVIGKIHPDDDFGWPPEAFNTAR